MPDQDDESALSAGANAAKDSVTNMVTSAAKGAQLVAHAFGLAPAPGEDNSNFPDDGSARH